jgi:two-component system, NtrC family, response regulator GlrR
MLRTKILIFSTHEAQEVGSQIEDVLQRDASLNVRQFSGRLNEAKSVHNGPPHLLIAIAPTAKPETDAFFRELRSLEFGTPLLFVLTPDLLSDGFVENLEKSQDCLVAPFNETELLFRVRRLINTSHRSGVIREATEACGLAQILGEDPKLVNLKRRIPIVARFDSTVLLTGETGTGKERFARALHYSSPRASKPFLPVNCGAIPVELFESELYGHRRGAFTGAVSAEPGLIAEADGGTLFLDEVETLSLNSQVKLLRFLQDQIYYPVGSPKPKQANVWILASTNIELPLKIQDGTFREDLYYRLAVISLALPPLRQRKGDIPLLAAHFWKMYSDRIGREPQPLSAEVVGALCGYDWPGNVRELQNVIQQVAVLSESEMIRPQDLPIPHVERTAAGKQKSFAQRKASVIAEFEKHYLTDLLRNHRGNVTHAAQEAGKDRRAFGRLIKKHQIDKRRIAE